jgi:hypothetical protein
MEVLFQGLGLRESRGVYVTGQTSEGCDCRVVNEVLSLYGDLAILMNVEFLRGDELAEKGKYRD